MSVIPTFQTKVWNLDVSNNLTSQIFVGVVIPFKAYGGCILALPHIIISSSYFQTKDNPYEASLLEIKGPGGCGLIVQMLTSNKIRTKNEINTILRKNG